MRRLSPLHCLFVLSSGVIATPELAFECVPCVARFVPALLIGVSSHGRRDRSAGSGPA